MSQTETLEPGVYRGNVELIIMLWDGVKASAAATAQELKAAIAERGGRLDSIHARAEFGNTSAASTYLEINVSKDGVEHYNTYVVDPGRAFMVFVVGGRIADMMVGYDDVARAILEAPADVVVIGESFETIADRSFEAIDPRATSS